MSMLNTLKDNQDLILLAEIGALIHDVGKLSKEFVVNINKAGTGEINPVTGQQYVDVHEEILCLHNRCPEPPAVAKLRDYDGDRRRFIIGEVKQWLQDISTGDPATDARIIQGIEESLQGAPPEKLLDRAQRFFGSLKAGRVMPTGQQLKKSYIEKLTANDGVGRLSENIRCAIHEITAHQKRFEQEKLIPADFLPTGADLSDLLYELAVDLNGDEARLSYYIEMHHGEHWGIPYLIKLLRAKPWNGVDGFDSWVDKGEVSNEAKQSVSNTLIATAFGHEAQRMPVGPDEDGLKPVRYCFAGVLAEELGKVRDGTVKPAKVRARILREAEKAFRHALGETRRTANDVTLWDHSYSVASLYKAALAKVLLEGKWTEPKKIGWRFLRVGVDGLRFFAQAHHVTDMLGRRRAPMKALNKVREVLEVEYPLGNEIYRDENGSIFVMPGLDSLDSKEAHEQLAQEVKDLILETFRQTGLGKELVPRVIWNDKKPVREEMIAVFGQLVAQPLPSPAPEPQAMHEWWEGPRAKGKEICTVCGVRPVGYIESGLDLWVKPQKAENRNVCGICMNRRGRRARDWARNEDGAFHRTIWIDEVADDNGRFALVVGRFVLAGWLDGRLVRTILVAPGISKNPSPARIRRIWETTRRFWQEVCPTDEHSVLADSLVGRCVGQAGPRLEIRGNVTPRQQAQSLGPYHTYELVLPRSVRLSVVWDEQNKRFITCGNLEYLGSEQQLGRPVQEVLMANAEFTVEEPVGYGAANKVWGTITLTQDATPILNSNYAPAIPILAEPRTFMALVPANRALEVVKAIKTKYEREMGKVRNRLPLHLGVIFAHRRTPVRAILEAGRRMLDLPTHLEERWQILEIKNDTNGDPLPEDLETDPHFAQWQGILLERDRHQAVWYVPLRMGDGETEDLWYPYAFVADATANQPIEKRRRVIKSVRPKGDGGTAPCWLVHAEDLVEGDSIYFTPSTFDFEFLDTTARRFEIHYDENGRRPRRTRPFYLEDLDRLEELWGYMEHLTKTQRHQVIRTIEATRETWYGLDTEGKSTTDEVFRQFVADTLAGAEWPKDQPWRSIPEKWRQELIQAGVRGELADLAELHMEILKEE